MDSLDRAVRQTLSYGAFFDFPLDLSELHHWLIYPKKVPRSALIPYHPVLSPKAIIIKKSLYAQAQQKIGRASGMASVLSYIPTIKLVAITGSVAIRNAKKMDDIDLLIVTADHTLWLTRPLVLFLLTLLSRRRLPGQDYRSAAHSFCPNLWLETRALAVPAEKRNLYTAHEVLQVLPILDRSSTYTHFIRANRWAGEHLANAYSASLRKSPSKTRPSSSLLSLIFSPFNFLAFIFQYLYMKPKMSTESVTLDSAYFHTIDFQSRIKRHLDNSLR